MCLNGRTDPTTGTLRTVYEARLLSETTSQNPLPRRIVGYLSAGDDLDRQATALRKTIQMLDGGCKAQFIVDPVARPESMHRPGFQRLLNRIARGDVDVVLVTNLCRLVAVDRELAELLVFLEQQNVRLLSLSELAAFQREGLNVVPWLVRFKRSRTRTSAESHLRLVMSDHSKIATSVAGKKP
jgi:hypothetical protein